MLQKDIKEVLDYCVANYQLPNKVEQYVKSTGTSIIAHKFEDGLMFISDTQSSIIELGIKQNCREKIYTLLDDAPQQYLFGLAGVAQLTRFVLKSVNYFYRWYKQHFCAEPSLDNIIKYLLLLHGRNSWNYYAHVVIGGLCARTNKFNIYCLQSGDLTNIEEESLNYCVLGSGSKYLTGALQEGITPLNKQTVKTGLVSALNVARNRDIGSGKDVQLFILTREGITKEIFKNLPQY